MSNVIPFRIGNKVVSLPVLPSPPRPKNVTWGEFLARYPVAKRMRDDYAKHEDFRFGPREMLPYLAEARTDDEKLAVLAVGVWVWDSEYSDGWMPSSDSVYSYG